MNSSSATIAQKIIVALQIYTISVYPIIFIVGLIGNFCNILIFQCCKSFRYNQSVFYLIIESIANFILLIIVLPFRTSEYVFGYDPTQLSLIWCKLRQAFVATISILSFSSICYAAIDQYLSTNYRIYLRQWSNLKLSHSLIYITVIILILYGIPFVIFFEIQPILGCTITNVGFSRFFSFIHFCVFSAVLPIVISVSFALLAYRNVRRIIRHQITITRRKLDRQLTALILTRVAFFVGTTLWFVIFRIYLLNESLDSNDFIRIAIEKLIFSITSSLFYINSAGSFYVFLLVSKRFRQQVKNVFIKQIWKKIFSNTSINVIPRHNQVHPTWNDVDFEQD